MHRCILEPSFLLLETLATAYPDDFIYRKPPVLHLQLDCSEPSTGRAFSWSCISEHVLVYFCLFILYSSDRDSGKQRSFLTGHSRYPTASTNNEVFMRTKTVERASGSSVLIQREK